MSIAKRFMAACLAMTIPVVSVAQSSACLAAKSALLDNVVLVPQSTAAANCVHTSNASYDISYVADGNARHKFDLFKAAGGPAPVVVWIHGGGWRGGSKANVEQVKRLVCSGYSVAAINYRLSDEALFPAQIHDVKAAIRYIRANASTLGVNGSKIATFGSSAGGHLAALAATSIGVSAMEDLTMGNSSTSSSVQAAIVWYGPTDFDSMDEQLVAQSCAPGSVTHNLYTSAESELLGCANGLTDPLCTPKVVSASPLTYVSANDPPIYMLHGDQDCVVPRQQTVLLDEAMEAAGRCSIRRVVQGAGHGNTGSQLFWTSAPVQASAVDFLVRFVGR